MSDVFFLVLRRLRTPLILLVLVYAIATLGLTLIPGATPDGKTYYMSFFHAFYFVSFMSTTIGFGEIPYEFTDAQRAWVLVCIFVSVVTWLYAIGNVLRLLQDTTFQQALAGRAFALNVQRIESPFYIICGYGETGALINQGLSQLGIQTVILDHNSDSTTSLELSDLLLVPIVMSADATDPNNLVTAGLNHPECKGIIAVMANDHTNLEVAVSSKLVNSSVPVICRSEIEDEANNMESFGTDVIINPYLTFASRLNLMAHNPALHRVQNWFINQMSAEHLSDRSLPKGLWLICGYGRLGKSIQAHLLKEDIETVIVDADPETSNAPQGAIKGRGTEAKTLVEAGIHDASVVVASSDDDANNLSILITARQLNKEIYTIGRVSREQNHDLFVKANCDYIMRRSQLVANEALTIISRPLVANFIKYSDQLSAVDTEKLIDNIKQLTGNHDPITWRLIIGEKKAPALVRHLQNGLSLKISQVIDHPQYPKSKCIPLLLQRGGVSDLLPNGSTPLQIGDELLLCGSRNSVLLPQRLADNSELIDSIINNNPHHIPLLRWWARRNTAHSANAATSHE